MYSISSCSTSSKKDRAVDQHMVNRSFSLHRPINFGITAYYAYISRFLFTAMKKGTLSVIVLSGVLSIWGCEEYTPEQAGGSTV